jgi:hypothetical protein
MAIPSNSTISDNVARKWPKGNNNYSSYSGIIRKEKLARIERLLSHLTTVKLFFDKQLPL